LEAGLIKYLLLDLDDTLLKNNMEEFAPPYFSALSTFLAPYVKPEVMLPMLVKGTGAMIANTNPQLTLEQVFDAVFYPGIGVSKSILHPHLEIFYDQVFPTLKKYTAEIPSAQSMIRSAMDNNIKLVVATNPLFPLKAIQHRLTWAGLGQDIIPYELITSYESFHFAKPNPDYFKEIIHKLHAHPDECAMVGNDLLMDILPASEAGMRCFQISQEVPEKAVQPTHPVGDHSQVIPWVLNQP